MKFKKHHNPIMGIYIEHPEFDTYGRTEVEWHFNLSENPELAREYEAWLAEGNQPEEWQPEEAN